MKCEKVDVKVQVMLTASESHALVAIADQQGRSISAAARRIIKAGLSAEEISK